MLLFGNSDSVIKVKCCRNVIKTKHMQYSYIFVMLKLFMISLVLPLVVITTISHGYKIQPRIINGVISDTSKYPFFVFLDVQLPNADSSIESTCGAALLNDR